MVDNESKDWQQLYQDALFEADLSKLPQRIDLASNAVLAKMRDLATSPNDSRERDILMDALRTLRTLRREKDS